MTHIEETEAAATELAARAPVRPDSPTFADMGTRPETVAALHAVGIERTFAIQEYALPIALRGADLIGQAPTGTGKTLGVGVPLLQQVLAAAEGADGYRSRATSRPPGAPATSGSCRCTAGWRTSRRLTR